MAEHLPSPEDRAALRERAVAALCTPELAAIVDLVVWAEDGTAYAANHLGRVRWDADDTRVVEHGTDPIGSEDPMAFLPYEREVADPSPELSTGNAYPYAAARLRSFFADPERSPDLAIVHTPRHQFLEDGGHVGEHGSLDVIQSRAPLVLSGAGVARRGFVDDHARLVDVGPTLAVLAGVPADALTDADGDPLDGRPLTAYLDGRRPRHVVGILWDGATSGDLLHLAETGELPGLARLLERGTALRGGAVAEFPSVTLTNHTAILTGVGPGRHGVMGNVYFDRATGETVVPNDETTWHRSGEWLKSSVRTVFEMVNDVVEPAGSPRTASVNEAIERGADYSTMQVIRSSSTDGAGSLDDMLPDPETSPFLRDHGVPGRPLLPVGRAGRRHRPRPDAPAVGRSGDGAAADLVGARGDRRRSPRRWPALGDGPRHAAAERRPAGALPRPPRGAGACSTTWRSCSPRTTASRAAGPRSPGRGPTRSTGWACPTGTKARGSSTSPADRRCRGGPGPPGAGRDARPRRAGPPGPPPRHP